MTKRKKKTQKPHSRDEQVMRLAHEILIKKLEPAGLTINETIDVLAILAKAIVIANTSDDDLEDRESMVEHIEERFMAILEDRDPEAEIADICPHAWLIPPQGLITEPFGILWSGTRGEESVEVMLGEDLAALRAHFSEKAKDMHMHVIEGLEGVAMVDPEWNGEDTIKCDNPDCAAVHDVHLRTAETFFKRAKQDALSTPKESN